MDKYHSRKEDRFWSQLLGIIARGDVVPIVGEDMLVLNHSNDIFFYDELAQRYIEECGIEQDILQQPLLSSTIRNHPEFRDNPHDIYHDIGETFINWNLEVPHSLIELAKVEHFNLFVSTTFDDLLEKAINQVRFNGKNHTRVLTYSPKKIPSDSEVSDALSSGRPVIIQMFGSYKNPLQYALTEGDRVEYMHALQSSEYCPKRIFNELHERPLIMLGNKFPDWLARLFLRMFRKTPLDYREIPKQYFADNEVASDAHLNFFLHKFTTNTEVIEHQNPVQFTISLGHKWQEKNANSDMASPVDIIAKNKPMPRNSVFISYCASNADGSISSDLSVALALKIELENVGIDVWLDQDELKAGDEYERKIERYINTCSLFMPLVSATTNSRSSGFFRKEWGWAIRRLLDFTGSSRPFLLPVLLGEIDPYTASIPDEFKQFQFIHLSQEGSNAKIIETIKTSYHKVLKQETQGIS